MKQRKRKGHKEKIGKAEKNKEKEQRKTNSLTKCSMQFYVTV
jgi:hypothetical protein